MTLVWWHLLFWSHGDPFSPRTARFLQMGVASVVMKDVASGVLRDEAAAALEAAGDAGPVEKLQALLTRVRPPDKREAAAARGGW